eukprot:gene17857-biopygen13275
MMWMQQSKNCAQVMPSWRYASMYHAQHGRMCRYFHCPRPDSSSRSRDKLGTARPGDSGDSDNPETESPEAATFARQTSRDMPRQRPSPRPSHTRQRHSRDRFPRNADTWQIPTFLTYGRPGKHTRTISIAGSTCVPTLCTRRSRRHHQAAWGTAGAARVPTDQHPFLSVECPAQGQEGGNRGRHVDLELCHWTPWGAKGQARRDQDRKNAREENALRTRRGQEREESWRGWRSAQETQMVRWGDKSICCCGLGTPEGLITRITELLAALTSCKVDGGGEAG